MAKEIYTEFKRPPFEGREPRVSEITIRNADGSLEKWVFSGSGAVEQKSYKRVAPNKVITNKQDILYDPETGEPISKTTYEYDPKTGERISKTTYEYDPKTGEPISKTTYEYDPETGKLTLLTKNEYDPKTGERISRKVIKN